MRFYLLGVAVFAALSPRVALAWGDEGHEIVALIADQYLDSATREKVNAMLQTDIDSLTAHDIANEANWADLYRDSDRNGSRQRYEQTRQWHFVDIELSGPSVDQACFGHPALPTGTVASNGPAQACIVDKLDQFAAELADDRTNPEERLLALKFILHFVGDIHQPLHASDAHDAGGNRKRVSAKDFGPGNLHHFWDTEFVEQFGRNSHEVAKTIAADITDEQRRTWARGTPSDWAIESFGLARDHAYGLLPEPNNEVYALDDHYISAAAQDVRLQLQRAGVRLTVVLSGALGH
jgi:hypothetical protein